MNKIHFDYLNTKSKKVVGYSSIILFLICLILWFTKPEYKWVSVGVSIFALTSLLPSSKIIFYKYYVSWNGSFMTIKVKGFLGKLLEFEEVKSVKTENKQLEIVLRSNKTLQFDLSHIEESDINKLEGIIKQYSNIQI